MAGFVAQGPEVMRRHIIIYTLIALFFGSFDAFAQDTERDKIRQMEEQKQNEKNRFIRNELDSAIALTNAQQYEAADEKYKFVLKNLRSLPSDLTYYFGKNSYMLARYGQSVDWLNKYIQLKGPTGQYYDEAVSWKAKAETELLKERAQQSVEATTILSRNYDIDCGPTGKVTCPVCNGSTVVIKKTRLGDQYKTCPYCQKNGYLVCEDYNKLLRGEFKPNP
jgi:hypothetical protein